MNFDPALGTGVSELVDLISQGELARARVRANELLERYPHQAELWRLLGISCLQQGAAGEIPARRTSVLHGRKA